MRERRRLKPDEMLRTALDRPLPDALDVAIAEIDTTLDRELAKPCSPDLAEQIAARYCGE